MMGLFFSAVALCLSLIGFNHAYCVSSLQKAYLSVYKGLLDESVVVAKVNGEYQTPKFYVPKAFYLLKQHFDVEAKPYCKDYALFVVPSGPGESLFASYCGKITVFFAAKVSDLDTVSRVAEFEIIPTGHE